MSMTSMFHCASGFNLSALNQPFGDWDVSGVTDMSTMFYSTSAFYQASDVSSDTIYPSWFGR